MTPPTACCTPTAASTTKPTASTAASHPAALPQSAAALHNTGRVLLQQNKFPEAIDALTRALQLNPNLPHAWNARGYAYMRLGQRTKALADFDQALKIDPNYQNARTNRAAAAAATLKQK